MKKKILGCKNKLKIIGLCLNLKNARKINGFTKYFSKNVEQHKSNLKLKKVEKVYPPTFLLLGEELYLAS